MGWCGLTSGCIRGFTETGPGAGPSVWLALASSFYTAVLGVLVIGVLSRMKKVFAFKGRSAWWGGIRGR